jgi:hypothetical protein
MSAKEEAEVISDTLDPAFWSIATVLGVATIYVAYLT